MAVLNLAPRFQPRADGSQMALVEVKGAVDATTVIAFETGLMDLLRQGIAHVAVLCAQMTYINSTGMGLMINLRDRFENAGGRLELGAVPPKIRTLFAMLGLESIFTLHESRDAAIAALNTTAAPSTPAPAAPKPQVRRGRTPFPVKITCASCKSKLRIPSAGSYRCPKCGIYYAVSDEARVKAYNTIKPKVVELKFPAELAFCESVRNAARAAAGNTRFRPEALDQLESAVDEAAGLVIARAAHDGRARFVQVFLVCDEREFVVGFKSSERLFENLNGDNDRDAALKLKMIQAAMSEVELIDVGRGQILKLKKLAGGA